MNKTNILIPVFVLETIMKRGLIKIKGWEYSLYADIIKENSYGYVLIHMDNEKNKGAYKLFDIYRFETKNGRILPNEHHQEANELLNLIKKYHIQDIILELL